MTTPAYNLLAVRKTLGAILHRLNESGLNPTIRVPIIDRQIADLLDTLPGRFHPLVHATLAANLNRDAGELLAGMALIEAQLPPVTYGQLVAGTVFKLPHGAALYIKRKEHVETHRFTLPHFEAGRVVAPVND